MEDFQNERAPMQEERVFFEQQSNTPRQGGKGKIWVAVLLVVVLLAGVAGWFIIKGRNAGQAELSPTPIETPELVEQTQAPTAAPQGVDKSKINIEILNGTGVTGEAAVLKGRLVPLGYSSIKTGNVSGDNKTTTSVSFASTVPDQVQSEILDTLRGLYQNVVTGPALTTSGTDVRITTGLRKGMSPKPSATATPKASSTPKPSFSPTASPSATPR